MIWSTIATMWLTAAVAFAGQSFRDIERTFKTAGVVPDVLPSFHPSALLQVTFQNITIVPGQNLTKEGMLETFALSNLI
jgi:hypothetical protein